METARSTTRDRHRHGRNDSSEPRRPLSKENKDSHDAASPSCSSYSGLHAVRPDSPERNGHHNRQEKERKKRRHSDSNSSSRSSSPQYRPRSAGAREKKSARRRHNYSASPHRQRRSARSRSPSEPREKKGVQTRGRSGSPCTLEHDSCASSSHNSLVSSESRPACHEKKTLSDARKDKQRNDTWACSGNTSNSTRRSSNDDTVLARSEMTCRDGGVDENGDQPAAAPPQMEQNKNVLSRSPICMPSGFLRRDRRRGGLCGGLARLKALRREEDFMYADFTSAGETAALPPLPEGASAAEVATAVTSCSAEIGAAAVAGKKSRKEHQEHPRLGEDGEAADTVQRRAIKTADDGTETGCPETSATAAAAGKRPAAESCASFSSEGGADPDTLERPAPRVLQQQQMQRSLHSKGGEQQRQGGTQGEGNGNGLVGKEKEGDEDEVLLEVEEEEEAAEVVRSMRELQKARQTRWTRKGLDVKSMEEKEKAAAAVEEDDEVAGYGLLEKSFSAVNNASGLTYDKHLEEFLRERMQLKEVQSNRAPAQQDQEGQGQQNNAMPSTEDLYKIPEHLQVPDRSTDLREQLNWLTGLTEVPLPLSAKLKNIEATEKAKRALLKKGNTGETLDDEDDPDVVRRKAFGSRYTWFDPDRRQRARAGDDRALQVFSQKGRRAQQMRGRVGIGFG